MPREEVCPFGHAVGTSPNVAHCSRWPWCPCLHDLLLHAVGHDDDQTAVIAEWWTEHWLGETINPREALPDFEDVE
jgi:hypothetical protein